MIGIDNNEGEFSFEEVSNTPDVSEADCVFRTTGDEGGDRVTGDEVGHVRFSTRLGGGIDVEMWVSSACGDNIPRGRVRPFVG